MADGTRSKKKSPMIKSDQNIEDSHIFNPKGDEKSPQGKDPWEKEISSQDINVADDEDHMVPMSVLRNLVTQELVKEREYLYDLFKRREEEEANARSRLSKEEYLEKLKQAYERELDAQEFEKARARYDKDPTNYHLGFGTFKLHDQRDQQKSSIAQAREVAVTWDKLAAPEAVPMDKRSVLDAVSLSSIHSQNVSQVSAPSLSL
jgi:hypothetical protein